MYNKNVKEESTGICQEKNLKIIEEVDATIDTTFGEMGKEMSLTFHL
jgi:hypothetical protein